MVELQYSVKWLCCICKKTLSVFINNVCNIVHPWETSTFIYFLTLGSKLAILDNSPSFFATTRYTVQLSDCIPS